MKWLWENGTKVCFGKGAVAEHLKEFVEPHSKVLCTFGGGSIDKNGARADVTKALSELQCDVRWEGGIPPNPEYDRSIEIVAVVKQFKPDLLLAVGGGSVLDATKFISLAAKYPDGKDPWRIVSHGEVPESAYRVGSVMTLPATGSEWNDGFMISRRSIKAKVGILNKLLYPAFSFLDPMYTMTLPARQLRNGAFDALCHVIDLFLTSEPVPMFDDFWISIFRELITIGPDLVKEGSSIELHERMIMAATFALNGMFGLGKKPCIAIHLIGHQLTAMYGIDHGATLAMCTHWLLETQFEKRKVLLAKVGEEVFKKEGTQDEKAHACIEGIRAYALSIGHVMKVSEVEGCMVKPNDLNTVLKMVMDSVGNKPFGINGEVTEADARYVLSHVIA